VRDILADGSVRQDGLVLHERDTQGRGVGKINYPVLARVLKVYDIDDDENNRNGDTVVCDLHVTELGITLTQAQVLYPIGGADNYMHVPIHENTANLDGSKFNNLVDDPKLADGDTVLVVFVMGDIHRPYILSVQSHWQSGMNGKVESPSPRPKKEDGKSFKLRINGTNFIIDKDGNVIFETTDVVNQDESEVPRKKKMMFNFDGADGQGHLFVFDAEDNSIMITHKSGSVYKMTGTGSILMHDSNGDSLYMDPSDQTLTLSSGQGSLLVLNQGALIIDSSGANIFSIIDENLMQITAGQDLVLSSPSCTIQSGTVNVGNNAFFHATIYENLKTIFDAHTHATGVGPSGPPLPPMTFAIAEASPATSIQASYVLMRGNL
jgi:hypothetical protein